MNDEPTPDLRDLDLAADPAKEADRIELITEQAVANAARSVMMAAAKARAREFYDVPNPEQIDSRIETIGDIASGDRWLRNPDGSWTNARTGAVMDYDPREPNAAPYAWVVEEFTYFHERWPGYPTAMAQYCSEAKKAIQSGNMGDIAYAKDVVAPGVWEGDSADAFRKHFLIPFVRDGGAVTSQQAVLDELAVAMSAYAALLKQARIDAKAVAEACVDRLDGMRVHSTGGSLKAVLALASVVAGVVGAVASGGGAMPVTLALIGQGFTLGRVAVDAQGSDDGGDTGKPSIKGDNVDEFMESLKGFMERFREAMDGVEAELGAAVADSVTEIERLLSSMSANVEDDQGEVTTILPYEPNSDTVPNITNGETPGKGDFRPPR